MLIEIILDTIIDTAKMVPFLFLAYLFIEYVEHHQSEKLQNALSRGGKFGFIPGAVLGIFPQCGFSAMAANLYAAKVITLGTLVAVFISTSDEAIPMLLASGKNLGTLAILILVKIIVALAAGFLVDFVLKRLYKPRVGGYSGSTVECSCHEHVESDSVLIAAIKHTVHISVYILAFSFVISLVVSLVGEENISAFVTNMGSLQLLVAALVGLIPNCAASIMITQLFIDGSLSFAATVAGLCSGAGVGLVVLFKANKSFKENVLIVGLVYTISIIAGIILQLFNI